MGVRDVHGGFLNLFLMRVCEYGTGSEPALTDKGKRQASMMAAFLKRQIGRVDIVISGAEAAAIETGEVMANSLGSYVATTTLLSKGDPDEPFEHDAVRSELERLWQQSQDVLVITPDEGLVEEEVGADNSIGFPCGSVALFASGELQWLVTPALIESTEELIEAARDLAESLPEPETETGRFTEAGKKIFVDEKGEYSYDEVEQKRLILGDGGKSGNCEYCEDAAALGWIDMDDVFEGPMGDEDESPPLHPACTCEVEQKTRRVRVYA